MKADILPKTKVEIVFKDTVVKEVMCIIVKTARTGTIGDGRIFVSIVDEVIRIRTDERENNAI